MLYSSGIFVLFFSCVIFKEQSFNMMKSSAGSGKARDVCNAPYGFYEQCADCIHRFSVGFGR